MDIHIYIYIILSTSILVLAFVAWNILRKYETVVDQILESEDRIITLEETITKTYDTMQGIDSKNMFAEDDEVGQTFKQLNDTIKELKGEIN
tara:strand:+ start:10586 stop:10861 length:276 start_codon:yes stop_codon:yes gene_type:complete